MVYEKTREIILNHLNIDGEQVTMKSSIKELGADSLDMLDILIDLEDEFDVDIPEKRIGVAVENIVEFIELQHPELKEQGEDAPEEVHVAVRKTA